MDRLRQDHRSQKTKQRLMKEMDVDRKLHEWMEMIVPFDIHEEYFIHVLSAGVQKKGINQENSIYCAKSQVILKLSNFFEHLENNAISLKLGEFTIEAALEIIKIQLSFNRGVFAREYDYRNMKYIQRLLQHAYDFIGQLDGNIIGDELLSIYLDCMLLFYDRQPQRVNQELLSKLISNSMQKMSEFITYFGEHLRSQRVNHNVVMNLIRGLNKRMPMFIEGLSTNDGRIVLMRFYLAFKRFLQRQPPNSVYFKILLSSQNAPMLKGLEALANKSDQHIELAQVFDSIIVSYMKAEISYDIKFPFIVNIFKIVLQKSSLVFGRMRCTGYLQEQQQFLQWFVNVQLSPSRMNQIIEVYMASKFAIEFLLSFMIYNMFHFPDDAPRLANLARSVNLLQESKFFIESRSLRQFLRVFYEYTDEIDSYEEFQNSVLDQTIAMDM